MEFSSFLNTDIPDYHQNYDAEIMKEDMPELNLKYVIPKFENIDVEKKGKIYINELKTSFSDLDKKTDGLKNKKTILITVLSKWWHKLSSKAKALITKSGIFKTLVVSSAFFSALVLVIVGFYNLKKE